MLGTSYQRPPSARMPGAAYYDTTLGAFVDSNGVNWQDRNANQVGNLLPPAVAQLIYAGSLAATSQFSPSGVAATLTRARTPTPAGRNAALSVLITGTGNFLLFSITRVPVTAGSAYSAAIRSIMSAVNARPISLGIQWYNGTTSTTSVLSGTFTPALNTWTSVPVLTAVCPAGSDHGQLFVKIFSTVPNDQFYLNEMCFAPPTPNVGSQATSAASGTGAVTSLTVTALTAPIPQGMVFQIAGDTNATKIVFTTTAAAIVGATTLAVTASPSVTTTIAAAAIMPTITDFIEP